MPARAWLVLGLSICFCEFPCSAQRSNPFGSHGGFGRGPAMTRTSGAGQFRPGGGIYRPSIRPHALYGSRIPQHMLSRGDFREPPVEFDSPHSAIPRSSFPAKGPDQFSAPDAPRRFGSGSEPESAFVRGRTLGSSSLARPPIQPPTQRARPSVPRPPFRLGGTGSPAPRPPFRFPRVGPSVPRPPLRPVALGGNSHFAKNWQLVVPTSRVPLSSRSFFSSPFFSNAFFFPQPLLFSPFFFNAFLFPQPFFFSLSFSNAFFFPRPLFFSPFFSNPFFFPQPLLVSPFFFNAFLFPQPFFFSLSFSNAFFFPRPLFFSPLPSAPFFQRRFHFQ